MRHNLNLNLHIFKRQILHADRRQQRLMVRTILLQIADDVARIVHVERGKVAADFVDLVPALAAGLLEGVFNVGEYLVDLLAEVGGDLRGEAVPATFFRVLLVWPPCAVNGTALFERRGVGEGWARCD